MSILNKATTLAILILLITVPILVTRTWGEGDAPVDGAFVLPAASAENDALRAFGSDKPPSMRVGNIFGQLIASSWFNDQRQLVTVEPEPPIHWPGEQLPKDQQEFRITTGFEPNGMQIQYFDRLEEATGFPVEDSAAVDCIPASSDDPAATCHYEHSDGEIVLTVGEHLGNYLVVFAIWDMPATQPEFDADPDIPLFVSASYSFTIEAP